MDMDMDMGTPTMLCPQYNKTVGDIGQGSTGVLKTVIDADAGKPLLGQIKMLWDKMISQEDHGQPYSPFESKDKWELAYWLSKEGLS